MTDAERQAALEAIAAEIRGCTRCRLHQGRTNAVPGEGSASTEVMFVGEGPGFNEDRQARPFVGRAGEKLTDWIRSIGWRRQDVFITNVVKCRPPDNRDPMPDEIAACTPFLRRQLEALDPAVVVTLGRFSMGWVMPGTKITQVHGTARLADPATGVPEATAYAMYHPAAALRSPEVDRQAADDMMGVPLALIAARERRARATAERAEARTAELDAQPQGIAAEPDPPIAEAETEPIAAEAEPASTEVDPAPTNAAPAPDPEPAVLTIDTAPATNILDVAGSEPAISTLSPNAEPASLDVEPASADIERAPLAPEPAPVAPEPAPAAPEPAPAALDPAPAAPEPPPMRSSTPYPVHAQGPQPDDATSGQLTLF